MRYYRYKPDINVFNGVTCYRVQDDEMLRDLMRHQPRSLCKELEYLRLKPDDIPPYHADNDGDFPDLHPHVPVMSLRAYQLLQHLLGPNIEVIHAEHPRHQYVVLNLLETVDAVDMASSQISNRTFPFIGRANIDKYYLRHDIVKGRHFVRIAHPITSVLVDDDFRSAVEIHNLRGLRFDPVPLINPPPN